jgi:hypothetical protein
MKNIINSFLILSALFQVSTAASEPPFHISQIISSLSKEKIRRCTGTINVDGLQLDDGYSYWGQQLVGGDLAKEVVRLTQLSRRPKIAIIDESYFMPKLLAWDPSHLADYDSPQVPQVDPVSGLTRDHGTRAANLLFSPSEVSLSEKAELVALYNSKGRGFAAALPLMERALPKIISMSLTVYSKDEVPLRQLAEQYTLVASAGNEFPAPVSTIKSTLPLIRVGSMSGWGAVARYSSSGESVDILAPSGEGIVSFSETGHVSFTGTSAAAPVVAGSLTNVLSLFSGLGREQLRHLLQHTAIPLIWSEQVPRKNGAGLVNAYKLAKVAFRLQEFGSNPLASNTLEGATIYDFLISANAELLHAKAWLKEATTKEEYQQCEAIKNGLIHLRKAFLLSDRRSRESESIFLESVAMLSDIFAAADWEMQADFYRSLRQDNLDHLIDKYLDHPNGKRQVEALRFCELLTDPFRHLQKGLRSKETVTREMTAPIEVAALAARMAHERGYDDLLISELKGKNRFVWNLVRDFPKLFIQKSRLAETIVSSDAASWRKTRFLRDLVKHEVNAEQAEPWLRLAIIHGDEGVKSEALNTANAIDPSGSMVQRLLGI